MNKLRGFPAKGVVDLLVQRRRRQPFLPAQHVRDLHQVIVYHHGQVIGGQTVAFEQHRIGYAGVLDRHVAADHVVDGRRAFQRRRKADHVWASLGCECGAAVRASASGGADHTQARWRAVLLALRLSCSSDRPCRARPASLHAPGRSRWRSLWTYGP